MYITSQHADIPTTNLDNPMILNVIYIQKITRNSYIFLKQQYVDIRLTKILSKIGFPSDIQIVKF